MTEMISFGGGVNSVAMTILLVSEGWRGPVVFSDTGSERPGTYCYLDYFEREFLRQYGLEIVRLRPGDEYHDRSAPIALYDYCLQRRVAPVWGNRWCSIHWKRRPLEKWRLSHNISIDLIGFDASEPHRIRDDDPTVRYPLVEHCLDRNGCRRLILQAGLEVPPKSSCFFCPNQSLAEWRMLHDQHPELYAKAEALEDVVSERAEEKVTLNPHGQSLREMRERRAWDGQLAMTEMAMPCICRT